MIQKTTEAWELADNLGSHEGARKWIRSQTPCSCLNLRGKRGADPTCASRLINRHRALAPGDIYPRGGRGNYFARRALSKGPPGDNRTQWGSMDAVIFPVSCCDNNASVRVVI
jgi:hypothetical protein